MKETTFVKYYEDSVRENWEYPALTDYFKHETFTYGELAAELAKLHLLFDACGIHPGDKIAVVGRNNPRWCISFLATITYGAVVVPILQDFNANDIQHIINHSESVLLFTGDQYWDLINVDEVESIRAAFSLTDFGCIYDRARESTLVDFQKNRDELFRSHYPLGFSSEDVLYTSKSDREVCMLNYTSGTSGFSKGVMLTGENLGANVRFGLDIKLHFRESRALSFLPLAHAYGCTFDFLYPLASGSHITLLGKIPSPKILVEALQEVNPHAIFCVPLIIEKIYKKQILPLLDKNVMKLALKLPLLDTGIYASIRKKLMETFGGSFYQIVIGGAPLNAEVEEFLRKIRFPFTVGYGMTECAPLISYTDWSEFKPNSCGRILPEMEVQIDSEDPERVPGEILVRGAHVMTGYFKNPTITQEVLSEAGWLHTGDVGTLDPDGTLHIRGRSKSMILRANGQNIYPEEIEAKLNNMPCVMESLVVEQDNRLVALVYPDYDECDSRGGLTQTQIKVVMEENKKELNELVAPYEQISQITLYPTEFEKTPKRSIKRYLYTIR